MPIYNEIIEKLEYLDLNASKTYLENEHIAGNVTSKQLEKMNHVLNAQVLAKKETTRLYNVKVAGFPFLKTIKDFDFDFQPTLNKETVTEILESNFYENGSNILFVGNPGTGKTHLSIAIGIDVATKRNSVYFIKFSKLIQNLHEAYTENRLASRLKVYLKYKLLIIDELGFNEISSTEAKLFFQLIDLRYEKKSTIISTNIKFDKWFKILGNDEMLAKAILDRLLHHSYIFNIDGHSYRLKDKLNQQKNEDKVVESTT